MNNNQIIDMQCNETTGRMMRPVAYIKSDFTSKFGIPRQSGLTDLEAEIHFYPEYQNLEAVRGLEEYSYLWLIWEFSRLHPKRMVPNRAPAKTGRKHKSRRLCHPLSVSSQSDRALQRATDRHYSGSSGRPGHSYSRRRSFRWNSDLRYQALHPLCRQPPRSPGKLRHGAQRRLPSGTIPAGTPEQNSAIKTKTPDPDPGSGSPPRLSAGPRKNLRLPLRRFGNQVPRRRRNPVCMRGQQRGEKIMEEIIRKYFACWLNKDEKPLTDIFAEDIIYSECYGPEYHGIRQIQQWFHDWNQKGTVQKWDVKQIYISRNTAIIEWYFQCNYCNTPGAFDGVTIAQFDGNNKIYNLKEFQSKCDHEYPYEPV